MGDVGLASTEAVRSTDGIVSCSPRATMPCSRGAPTFREFHVGGSPPWLDLCSAACSTRRREIFAWPIHGGSRISFATPEPFSGHTGAVQPSLQSPAPRNTQISWLAPH